MVGLGPIQDDMFKDNVKNEKNYDKAKVNIVRQYLREVFKYEDEEIENLKIEKTKVTRRDETYIYIAVSEIDDIKDIYRRKAEVKRDDIILRSYVPPQFYARFKVDIRKLDTGLKTQIQFGQRDLEVLVKYKGSNEPFNKVNLKEFIGDDSIPEFDTKIKWTNHKKRLLRRRVTSSRSPSPAKQSSRAHGPATRKDEHNNPSVTNQDKTPRQPSWKTVADTPSKRTKKETSLDSCHTMDMDAALIENSKNNCNITQ